MEKVLLERRFKSSNSGAEREDKMSYTVAKGNQRVDPDEVKVSGKALEGVVDLRRAQPCEFVRTGVDVGDCGMHASRSTG